MPSHLSMGRGWRGWHKVRNWRHFLYHFSIIFICLCILPPIFQTQFNIWLLLEYSVPRIERDRNSKKQNKKQKYCHTTIAPWWKCCTQVMLPQSPTGPMRFLLCGGDETQWKDGLPLLPGTPWKHSSCVQFAPPAALDNYTLNTQDMYWKHTARVCSLVVPHTGEQS